MLLNQLYQNLIGNAIKFTAGRQPMIHLTADHDHGGEPWTLGVRDNGIGIKSEFAQLIFAPFQRLNSRDQYEGAGIGLTICKKVVQRHGGRIWVESRPGAGAHFKFLLPAHEVSGFPVTEEKGSSASAKVRAPSECEEQRLFDGPVAGVKRPSPRVLRKLQEPTCLT
jgi:K+-sensing histidine kinase KdpD